MSFNRVFNTSVKTLLSFVIFGFLVMQANALTAAEIEPKETQAFAAQVAQPTVIK